MENNVNNVRNMMGNSNDSNQGGRIEYDPETRTFKTTNDPTRGIKATKNDLTFGC